MPERLCFTMCEYAAAWELCFHPSGCLWGGVVVCTCFVAGVRGGLEASSGLKPQRRCGMEGTCIGAWQHSEGGQRSTLADLGTLRGGAHGPLAECRDTLRELFCSPRLQEVGCWYRPCSPRAPCPLPGAPTAGGFEAGGQARRCRQPWRKSSGSGWSQGGCGSIQSQG